MDPNIINSAKVKAEILEPSSNLEDTTEFHSQLFVKFDIIADLHNVKVSTKFFSY